MNTGYFELIVHNYNEISPLIPNNFGNNVGMRKYHNSAILFVLNLRHIIPGVIKIVFK